MNLFCVTFAPSFTETLIKAFPEAADKVSSPKIASGSRLCRAVKRAIFVPFRQAALRLRRRKLREAGFVINLKETLIKAFPADNPAQNSRTVQRTQAGRSNRPAVETVPHGPGALRGSPLFFFRRTRL